MSLRGHSSYDSPRPRTLYADGYMKGKGIPKTRARNNGATRRAGSLKIDTVFPDALGAMKAHCTGETSPQSGGCFIRRTTPPSTEAMMIEARDDYEATSSKSQGTPLALREFWRSLVGGFGTAEKKHFESELPVISEGLFSSDTGPPHSTSLRSSSAQSADDDIVNATRGTEGTAPSSPHENLQTKLANEPPLRKSVSQYDVDENELSPLSSPIPSNVNLPLKMFHNLGITATGSPTSSMADEVNSCSEDIKSINEVQLSEQRTTNATSSSSADMDQPTTDGPSISADNLSPSGCAEDHTIKDSPPVEQDAPLSCTQSPPEIVQHAPSIDVSADAETQVDKERREGDVMQGGSSGATHATNEEPDSMTASLVSESRNEQSVNENDTMQAEEKARSPVPEVLDSPVAESEPKALKTEYSSSAAELGPPLSNATGEQEDASKIRTDTSPNNASGLYVETPTILISPPEPSALEVASEPSTPDVSEASNVTEQHVDSSQSEATDELCQMGSDLSPAKTTDIHVEALTTPTTHSDSSGVKVMSDPVSTASTPAQFNSDTAVPSSQTAPSTMTTSGTASEKIDSNTAAHSGQAKLLSKAQRKKQRRKLAKRRGLVQGEIHDEDDDYDMPSSPIVPNVNEMQGASSDSAEIGTLDSTSSNVDDDNDGCSRMKESSAQENAAVDSAKTNVAESVPVTSRKADSSVDHVAATPGENNQASPTTSSDQYKPESSPASEDALTTREVQQNSSTEVEDVKEQSIVLDPSASGSSSTDTPPEASSQTAKDTSCSPILFPLLESSENVASTSEAHHNDSTAQSSESNSLQTENSIEVRDVEEKTTMPGATASSSSSTETPAVPRQTVEYSNNSPQLQSPILELSKDDLPTDKTHYEGSTGNPAEDIEEQDIVPDASASGSSSTDTLPATTQQTAEHSNNSPKLQPPSSGNGLPTAEIHPNESPAQMSQLNFMTEPGSSPTSDGASSTSETQKNGSTNISRSNSLQTGNLIDLGDRENQTTVPAASSSSPAASHQTTDRNISSNPDASDGTLPTGETCPNGSAVPISQLDGILVDLEDVDEQTAARVHSESSTDTGSSVAPCQMGESFVILPPIPESSQIVDEVLDLISPRISFQRDLRTDDTAISADWVDLIEPDTETAVSPTRTLAPQDAELSLRSRQLEEEHVSLKEKYEELERKYNELESKFKDLQKHVENHTAAGANS